MEKATAAKVLKASASMLNLIGISQESSDYVQQQMATLLGLSDENKMAQVAKLWEQAFHFKKVVEREERELFAYEAKVTGYKYSGDVDKYAKQVELVNKLKQEHNANIQRFRDSVAEAQQAQDKAMDDRF